MDVFTPEVAFLEGFGVAARMSTGSVPTLCEAHDEMMAKTLEQFGIQPIVFIGRDDADSAIEPKDLPS
jgi:hypothetical protein